MISFVESAAIRLILTDIRRDLGEARLLIDVGEKAEGMELLRTSQVRLSSLLGEAA